MLIVFLILILFYILYILGYLTVSTKRAVMFVGSMGFGKPECHASFTSCTGHIHRCVRFQESRSYSFRFLPQLSAGQVTVQLLDSHRKPMLTLTETAPTGVIPAEKRKQYFLYVRFQNASGSYQIDWE